MCFKQNHTRNLQFDVLFGTESKLQKQKVLNVIKKPFRVTTNKGLQLMVVD